METAIAQAVARVITDMHANFGEELTIDDMAQTAGFSKFHFTRGFTNVTGVSPRRFLRAIRFQEAKRLLVNSELNIAEISHAVGYSSVGTFSSCFKSCTGITPSTYRQLAAAPTGSAGESEGPQRRSAGTELPTPLRGQVLTPSARPADFVFLGLFPTCIPQGHPVRCAVLTRPGEFILEDVPPGTWYMLARSVSHGDGDGRGDTPTLAVGVHGPITVIAGRCPDPAVIQLRHRRVDRGAKGRSTDADAPPFRCRVLRAVRADETAPEMFCAGHGLAS
ncbi:helix-turn-helix transcriptional regulator [Streptomyces sp. NPDC091292]|uniref:helix-turn-helix transcriptional regulator n=1 Tax=Streptomyces sp. NPDC091292 TaxID=3365991 RepID=UPI003818C784